MGVLTVGGGQDSEFSHGGGLPRRKKQKLPVLFSLGLRNPRRRGRQRRRWLGSITDYDEFEFEQTPRDSGGQWTVRRVEDSLGFCSPWGCQELQT